MDPLRTARLMGVAANPTAPVDLLLRILALDAPEAHRRLLDRGDLPDAVIDAALAHPAEPVRQLLARSWHAPAAQRSRLVDDPSPVVRADLALGPAVFRRPVEALPDEVYERLAADPSEAVRAQVAGQRQAPAHLRERLLDDPAPKVRFAALYGWRHYPRAAVEARLGDPDPGVAFQAAEIACTWRPDLVGGLLDADWFEGELIGETAALGPGTAARLARHPYVGARMMVALNPGLPAALVAELAADPEHRVRLAVSMRPGLTEEQRAAIDYRVRAEDGLQIPQWLAVHLDDPERMAAYATSAHVGLRRAAACCGRLPADLVELLARDDDPAVRLLLCENHPDAPADVLLATFLETRVISRYDLIDHPNFPRRGLADLAGSSHDDARTIACLDPDAPAELIEKLSRDPVANVRVFAAADPRLPLVRMIELLDSPSSASSAARNPGLPPDRLRQLVEEQIA